MPEEAPKASREHPSSALEHARNVPGASLERPERTPTCARALQGSPRASWRRFWTQNGIPEIDFGGHYGYVLAFSGHVSILRASIFKCDRAHASRKRAAVLSFVVRVFCEDFLFDLFLKAPRLNFRRLHVGSLFYTIFFVAILQVHLVIIYIVIYILFVLRTLFSVIHG